MLQKNEYYYFYLKTKSKGKLEVSMKLSKIILLKKFIVAIYPCGVYNVKK